jgi:oligoribonuclease
VETEHPALVWIDLEMTGLEPEACHILEIATIVTDSTLERRVHGPELVIHQSEEVLAEMNPWCVEHHGQSGLTQRVRDSKIPLAEAEAQTVAFLREHCPVGRSPLCGNSVGLDKAFIDRHMPALSAFLGPQVVDVTAIKELARRWYPNTPLFPKNDTHRALDDIVESIEELRFYREHLFRPELETTA